MIIPQPLLDAAASKRLVPFIGSGFSKVFALPTWNELINDISIELGYDPAIASIYGDFLQLAEFMYIEKDGISELRSKLDRKFNADVDISKSKQHQLLTLLNPHTIYTTNWDSLIERAFEHYSVKYNRIATINDFQKSTPDVTSIVKFHGDFSATDDSIVFTESSYYERLSFESPLDIRLRADMMSNTLLFLGYSLSDTNVRYMWYKLQKLLLTQHSTKSRNPFAYIVTFKPNPVFEAISTHSRNIGVISLDPLNPVNSMEELLNELQLKANS